MLDVFRVAVAVAVLVDEGSDLEPVVVCVLQCVGVPDRQPEQNARAGERGHGGATQGGGGSGDGHEVRGRKLPDAGLRRHGAHKRLVPHAPLAQRLPRGRPDGQEAQVPRRDAPVLRGRRQGLPRY